MTTTIIQQKNILQQEAFKLHMLQNMQGILTLYEELHYNYMTIPGKI